MKNQKQKLAFQPWWIPVTVSLLLLIGEYVGLTTSLRNIFESGMKPFFFVSQTTVKVVRLPYLLINNSYNTAARIQDLESRYSESLAALSRMDALEEENDALRQLIENKDRKFAQIVLAAPILSYGIPHISVGSGDGVEMGDPVLVSQTLVGRIQDVFPEQSEVRLLSHPLSLPILAKTQSGVDGLIVGDGRNVLLTEVSMEVELNVGDRVTTVGQQGLQRDIFIGKISKIKKDPELSTQYAIIEQVVSFFDARIVEVYQ